jgi:FG-GAP-like repeat/FG-GAP repeat
MNREPKIGRCAVLWIISRYGAPPLLAAAMLLVSGLFLASCGSGGFGCGDSGVGPCGPPLPGLDLNWSVAIADFNHDGFLDVVVNHSTGAVKPGFDAMYLHDSAPGTGFESAVQFNDSTAWSELTAVDLDGDGLPDLVSLNGWSFQISVFLNNPQNPGNFGQPTILDTQFANQVIVADLNGDGAPDLLVADNQLSLFLQNPAARGSFAAPIPLYTAGAAFVDAGDLNDDGLPDVVVGDQMGVEVLYRTGAVADLTFAPPVTVWTRSANPSYGGAVNQVKIVDLTGSGRSDLVLTDPGAPGAGAKLVIMAHDPLQPGAFLPAVTYPLPVDFIEAVNFVATDLNGDGYPDLVFGGLQTVTVYLQDPLHPGTFASPTTYAAPNGATYVAVADIDGDGRPDIVLSDGATTSEANGVITGPPGLMLQDPAQLGHFKAIQDLN